MLYRFLIVFILIVYGCTNQKKETSDFQIEEQSKGEIEKIVHSIGEVLNADAKKLINPWQEYHSIETVIGEYYNILPDEALLKAKNLSNLTQQLRDSIRIKRFNQPDIKIRLNILNNTALRLADMENIPEIENDEIKTEVRNLINAFSSINSKVNNIVNKENLENQLSGF